MTEMTEEGRAVAEAIVGPGRDAAAVVAAAVSATEADSFAALRAECAAAIKADGLSDERAAREIGIGGSTLNAWRNGSYTGNNETVAGKVRIWLDARRSRAATRAVMPRAPGFVATPSARAFIGVLDHAQHTPDMALISGGAGVGKTTAVREYQRANPQVFVVTGQPYLREVGARMFLDGLAEVMGEAERRTSQRIVSALVRRLTGTNALLVVDEAQNLSTRALDQVRSLHDMAGIGVALVGNEEVHGRLEGAARSADYAQLFSRVGMRIARPAPTEADVEAVLDGWGVPKEGGVRSVLRDVARETGALRGAIKTLGLAYRMLQGDEGATALTERHVRLAWRKLSSSPRAAAAAVVSAARRELSQAAASADA